MNQFKGENLFAKIRYNIHHQDTDLRWRLFIKQGGEPEKMYLVKEFYCYVPQRSYSEMIEGVGHYSVLAKTNKITIDDDLNAWIQ